MSLNRYAKKRDKNEPEIIEALRAVGALVWQIDQPVDLVVLFDGRFYLLEIKTPKGKLTPTQVTFFEACDDANVGIARTVYDALELIGAA